MAVRWRLVELEVARVDDAPDRGLDGDPDHVRDRVAHGYRLDAKAPELHGVADAVFAQVGLAQDPVLLQLGLDQAEGQPRPVDRNVQLLQRKGQPADVVLMTVGQEDADDLATGREQVGDVGEDKVDAEHVLLREHEARVDDDDLVLPLQHPHVDAARAEAAEREVPKTRAHKSGSCSASCLGVGSGSGGGGGARNLSRYLRTLSKSRSRSATSKPLWSAAAGWYRGTHATSPRRTRLPWMREMDPWPGSSCSSAWRPRMSTTLGLISSSWRFRSGVHGS